MESIEARLEALGLRVPEPVAPVANYVPFIIAGSLLFVSGQLPMRDGQIAVTGKLGAGVTIAEAREACRIAFLNVLAQAKLACGGDLGRIARVVRLGGFIACTPDFTQHALAMNGASDLCVELFGEAGRHTRTTIGVASLPADATAEVEALFLVH